MMRFRRGQRVRFIGHTFLSGLPQGIVGTVAEVSGFFGKSIYPDPAKRMVWVEWDNRRPLGVYKFELEHITEEETV